MEITQSSPEYVLAVLKKVVPEYEEGLVVVDKVARIAGTKTKILVSSTQEGVDPVGVMVGQKGDRINTVLGLLDGEKVDFTETTDDLNELITRLLKPATIENIDIKSNGKVVVRVQEDQKPLAF